MAKKKKLKKDEIRITITTTIEKAGKYLGAIIKVADAEEKK